MGSGLEAWKSGNLQDFGKLISASGLSSIYNYECGTTLILPIVFLIYISFNRGGMHLYFHMTVIKYPTIHSDVFFPTDVN